MRSALQYLRCESIADTTKSDAEMGFTNAVEYVAQTRDGFTYTATLGGEAKDGERYARFAVAYAKPEAPADADEKALEEFQKKCDANAKKTADLDAKLKLWTYRISDAKAQNLTLPRSQLVKEKETGKTEE
jgi:hypothetical protein